MYQALSFEQIRKIITLLVAGLLLAVSLSIFAPAKSSAFDCPDNLTGTDATKCQTCKASGASSYTPAAPGSPGTCVDDASGETAETKVTTLTEQVINIFSWVVGVASVLMIMVGGFKYITSQGDSGNISSAKNTILYAIIGLVIVAFTQVIVRFVINKI